MAATPPSTACNPLDDAWWGSSIAEDVSSPAELTPLLLPVEVARRLQVCTRPALACTSSIWSPCVTLRAATDFKRGETVFAELAVGSGNPAMLASEAEFRARLCLAGALASPERATALVRMAEALRGVVFKFTSEAPVTRLQLLWALFTSRAVLTHVTNSARPDAPTWACVGPRTTLLAHDCDFNIVCVSTQERGHASMGITWIAARDIAQGELLSRSYVTPYAPVAERHRTLTARFSGTCEPVCPCTRTGSVDVMTAFTCACGQGVMHGAGDDLECEACHARVSMDARTHACATATAACSAHTAVSMLQALCATRLHPSDGACITLLRAAARDTCAALRAARAAAAALPLTAAQVDLLWSCFHAVTHATAVRARIPLPDLLLLACDVAFVMAAHAAVCSDAASHSSDAYAVAAGVCELASGVTTRQEVELLRSYVPKPPRTLAEARSADKLVWLTRSAEW